MSTVDAAAPSEDKVAGADAPFDYKAHLPQEYATEKVWESVPDFKTLAKNYVEAQRYIGGAIRLPTDKDKPEEAQAKWNDLYNKMGRPESPDKYDAKLPDIEGLQWDAEVEKTFKEQAHKLGLTTPQLKGVMDFYGSVVTKQIEGGVASQKEARATLEKEWGARTDYNLQLAQKAFAHFGTKELGEKMEQTGWGNDPALLKIFARLGQELAEDKVISTDVEGQTSGADDAKAKIAAIKNDPKHAYNDKNADWKAHQAAIDEVDRLYAVAYGTA